MPGAPYALPALAAELVRIPVNVIVTDAMKAHPVEHRDGHGAWRKCGGATTSANKSPDMQPGLRSPIAARNLVGEGSLHQPDGHGQPPTGSWHGRERGSVATRRRCGRAARDHRARFSGSSCCNVVTLDAERLPDDLAARSPSSQLIACAGRLVSVRLTDF